MKITDSQVIRDGEKELINAVKDKIDPEKIRELLANKLSGGNLKARDGEIVIHNNQIAFQLNFELQFTGSILLDREGHLLSDEVDQEESLLPQENSLVSNGDIEPDFEAIETIEDELDPANSLDNVEDFEDILESDEDTIVSEDDNAVEEKHPSDANSMKEDFSEEDLFEDEEDPAEHEHTDKDIEDILLDSDEEENLEIMEDEDSISDDILIEKKDNHQHSSVNEDEIDEDINDILEESRAFWKQNKKKDDLN